MGLSPQLRRGSNNHPAQEALRPPQLPQPATTATTTATTPAWRGVLFVEREPVCVALLFLLFPPVTLPAKAATMVRAVGAAIAKRISSTVDADMAWATGVSAIVGR